MSEFGIKIRNIQAATLFDYNQGTRYKYEYTDAMLNNSLFCDYLKSIGLTVWKEESTRDVICLDYSFGTRSFEEELDHIDDQIKGAETDEQRETFSKIRETIIGNKDNYVKYSQDELRERDYVNGVTMHYPIYNEDREIVDEDIIHYKMLYRTPAKAKVGKVMFINEKLYKKAHEWLTMGLAKRMPKKNAKIVELSAYAPLTTSTIVDRIHIPVENILILRDQDSCYKTMAKIVRSEEYLKTIKVIDEEKTASNKQKAKEKGTYLKDGSLNYRKAYKYIDVPVKKCVVADEESEVKNTIWDGMGLVESSILPSSINGMMLLRNHFFKACVFRSNIQLFFQDCCEKNGIDYETYEIEDMFGIKHLAKNIQIITTDNAIKWKKFVNIMGGDLNSAYDYWCDWINKDGSIFGIVKTDHPSKLNDVQQMSYQMINTLPATQEDIDELSETSRLYVERLKRDEDFFIQFLRDNANMTNHYEMMVAMYDHNTAFANSTWFRAEKKKVINNYVNKLRKGKITINADNLTLCGNPYALLLYTVGEDWESDPTLNYEDGSIQCYTTRFADGEYLCGIRNPHNSPNNLGYFHNKYSPEMERYFPFSENILALNCIKTDIQSRLNGADFDSDFCFTTNNPVVVRAAKVCFTDYPTIVNDLKESGVTYNNTLEEYARMDSKFAKSRMGIGESSNLAQLAMTYYWTEPSKELYDNFVILSVLAQIIIDGCKREYEIDGNEEIKRIKRLPCMVRQKEVVLENGKVKKTKSDFPLFMKYTREIATTKNRKALDNAVVVAQKHKLKDRINEDLVCPMNYLQVSLSKIKYNHRKKTIPTKDFFIKIKEKPNVSTKRRISAIRQAVDDYMYFLYCFENTDNDEENIRRIIDKQEEVIELIRGKKLPNALTVNRLIESGLNIENKNGQQTELRLRSKRYGITIMGFLFRMDRDLFLSNFKPAEMPIDIDDAVNPHST